jgi:hypothetical protein
MRRRAFALAVLLALALLTRDREPSPTILYRSNCSRLGGWEWVTEGCWWQ